MTYAEKFIKKTRSNSTEYYCTEYNELEILIRNIHFDHFFGCLPNDWLYDTIHTAFCTLENTDVDCLEEACYQVEADPYDKDLMRWFSDNAYAVSYYDEVREEGLANPEDGFYKVVAMAQQIAKERIYLAVLEFLKSKRGGE